jgi:hypothetical protein
MGVASETNSFARCLALAEDLPRLGFPSENISGVSSLCAGHSIESLWLFCAAHSLGTVRTEGELCPPTTLKALQKLWIARPGLARGNAILTTCLLPDDGCCCRASQAFLSVLMSFVA